MILLLLYRFQPEGIKLRCLLVATVQISNSLLWTWLFLKPLGVSECNFWCLKLTAFLLFFDISIHLSLNTLSISHGTFSMTLFNLSSWRISKLITKCISLYCFPTHQCWRSLFINLSYLFIHDLLYFLSCLSSCFFNTPLVFLSLWRFLFFFDFNKRFFLFQISLQFINLSFHVS